MGNSSILGLLFEINADPSKAQAALAKFSGSIADHLKIAQSSMLSAEQRGEHLGLALEKALKTGAVAAVAVGGALFEMARRTANAAEEFLKLSAQVGVSVHDLSALKFVAELNETSFEALTQGLRIFNRNIAEINPQGEKVVELLNRLGIETRTAGGEIRPTSDLLVELADRFKAMPDGAEKTALAMTLFGRAGAALIPLLNQGSVEIARQTKLAEQLGVVMDDKAARAADNFGDQLVILKAALTGIQQQIGFAVIPTMTEYAVKMQLVNLELKEWKLRLESLFYALKATALALVPFKGDEARAYFQMAADAANEAAETEVKWNAQLSETTARLHWSTQAARQAAAAFGDLGGGGGGTAGAGLRGYTRAITEAITVTERFPEAMATIPVAITSQLDPALEQSQHILDIWAKSAQRASDEVQAALAESNLAFLESVATQIEAQNRAIVSQTATLLQHLGLRKAAAIVEAVWETAQGIAALARRDFGGAAQHFLSAATYGVVAGQGPRGASAVGAGVTAGAGGGAVGTTAGGSATSRSEERQQVFQVIFQGPVYGGPAGIDELARLLSEAVQQRDVNLTAYTVVRQPAPRA